MGSVNLSSALCVKQESENWTNSKAIFPFGNKKVQLRINMWFLPVSDMVRERLRCSRHGGSKYRRKQNVERIAATTLVGIYEPRRSNWVSRVQKPFQKDDLFFFGH